jgi:tetratricopeptide (TPR) repeat protein
MSNESKPFKGQIKPLYLYGALVVLAIVFLIIFTSGDNAGSNGTANLSEQQMPDDDIHRGLQNPLNTPPGKDNVSEEIKHQLEMLKKAVDENPQDTLKLREYADLLAAAHRVDEAVVYYYKLLNINPRRPDIFFSLAFIYYQRKDYDKVEDLTNKILLYEPDNSQAKYNLGAVAAVKGEKEKARKIWEEVIKKYPGTEASELAESSLQKL